MSVLAIIAALLIEQWRPLGERKSVSGALAAWAASLERAFNGGERRHGLVAWMVAVLPPVAFAALLYALLSAGEAFTLAERAPLLDQQRGDDRKDTHASILLRLTSMPAVAPQITRPWYSNT